MSLPHQNWKYCLNFPIDIISGLTKRQVKKSAGNERVFSGADPKTHISLNTI
jgi:hypothetical protein